MTQVRTRFAPSPTGPLHIGGVHTALFSWLMARHEGGRFILRIEDTDQKRFVPGSLEMIIETLQWLGINWDEGPDIGGPYGPYIQSERLAHYQQWAHWLVDQGHAYRCYCSPERLDQVNRERQVRKEPPGYDRHCRTLGPQEIAANDEAGLPFVIRFRMPTSGETVAEDVIRGEVIFSNDTLQDAVLLKSDGFPTYHLAHIVDDHLMAISHVTRAVEWLPSYPLHVNIWRAFGWDMPIHAHVPVLLNPNGQGKLSKRHAGFSHDGQRVLVLGSEYREAGYQPEAVVNFLAGIGWSFGEEREKFDVQEAIERFHLRDVHPANSAFQIEKLDWLNGLYIREMALEDLAPQLQDALTTAGYTQNLDRIPALTPVVQTRLKRIPDVVQLAGFLFEDDAAFTAPGAEVLIPKGLDRASTREALQDAAAMLADLEPFDYQSQYDAAAALAANKRLKNGQLFGALRVAVTGQTVSPPTFETIEILGREEALRRIHMAIAQLA
jgi:glutamyl-tRNA synthetase